MCGDSDYSAYGTVEDAIVANGANLVIDNGYKIPISSASTTTPVYLGEVQSTRRIKKYVVTGQESEWNYDSTYTRFTLRIPNAYFTANRSDETPCSHYVSIHDGRPVGDVPDKSIYITSGGGAVYINIVDLTYSSLSDFKTYLQQQYAAGTPVTVWYVLATETTTTLNEPLRKIGTYSDSVSGTNLAVTAQSPTTIDVDTSLKPSEMDLTYTGLKMCGRKRKSANLLNQSIPPENIYISSTIKRMGYEVELSAGTYTVYGNDADLYAKTKIDGVYGDGSQINTALTLTLSSNGSIIVYGRINGEFPNVNIMFNTGSSPLPYTPYWK